VPHQHSNYNHHLLLDEKIPDWTDVKLWRPKPTVAERTPIWLSTALFYESVPENPSFHVVSPCFAIAKVWKKGDTVYVNIEKEKKCDVGDCDTGVPFSFKDTPNYCYADEEYIWGEDLSKGDMLTRGDVPSEVPYIGGAIGCTIACAAATHGAWQQCLRTCSYAAIGVLTVNTIAETYRYEGSSWKRQDTGWGYWNYEKAGDVCDILDIMASFGSPSKAESLTRWQQVKSQFSRDDLCYFLLIVGGNSLAWPIKTPFGMIWRKGADLSETCIQESSSSCAWLNKCFSDNDCPLYNPTDPTNPKQICDLNTNLCINV